MVELCYGSTDEQDENTLRNYSDEFKKFGSHVVIKEKMNETVYISIWLSQGDDSYRRIYSNDGPGVVMDGWFEDVSSESNLVNDRP
jgi:hypothetical protein